MLLYILCTFIRFCSSTAAISVQDYQSFRVQSVRKYRYRVKRGVSDYTFKEIADGSMTMTFTQVPLSEYELFLFHPVITSMYKIVSVHRVLKPKQIRTLVILTSSLYPIQCEERKLINFDWNLLSFLNEWKYECVKGSAQCDRHIVNNLRTSSTVCKPWSLEWNRMGQYYKNNCHNMLHTSALCNFAISSFK